MSYSELFSSPLLAWFDIHGRKHLPWQHPRSAYRVFISELMLQQTQVKTVIPYFIRFIERFPDVYQLAAADEDEVFSYWSGLGYYQRARFLHKTAAIVVTKYAGEFPRDLSALIQLPGIGPSTAAAIASLAFDQATAILDGNVIRVLSRYFLVDGIPIEPKIKQQLWALAKACMPNTRCADYTQAIMDLGATCCVKHNPRCEQCPLSSTCRAYATNQTAQYPYKKPKKIRPVKHTQLLLMHTPQHHIYLEKRPAIGIWGGLWSLPDIDKEQSISSYLLDCHGIASATISPLVSFKHGFTHFQLHINAYAIYLSDDLMLMKPGNWFTKNDTPHLGIPKPISRIIDHFYREFPHARIT